MRLVKPDFAVTSTNEQVVAALCRRLEGLPLAMEMAAALGRTLSPTEDTGTSGTASQPQRDASQRSSGVRHQSLRATIEWSYELLSPSLQTLFMAGLSVFRGGWTPEAVEEVCGEGLQAILELVERSLVVSEEDAEGEVRYRLLETLARVRGGEARGAERNRPSLRPPCRLFFASGGRDKHRSRGGEEDKRQLVRIWRENMTICAWL